MLFLANGQPAAERFIPSGITSACRDPTFRHPPRRPQFSPELGSFLFERLPVQPAEAPLVGAAKLA
jgi:hypothetical protein